MSIGAAQTLAPQHAGQLHIGGVDRVTADLIGSVKAANGASDKFQIHLLTFSFLVLHDQGS